MTTTNYLKTALLLGLMTGLILVCGQLLGGRTGMMIALGLAAAMNFGSYWFSDKIVLRLYRAQPVSEAQAPRLHAMVGRLVAQAGLPKPTLYVLSQKAPNAFATGRNPEHAAVAVTAGLLELMTEEEAEGVIAHELAHIKNRDILISSIAATIAPIAAMIIQMAVSRSREYAADATGARIAGNPHGLARALEKLEQYSKRIPMQASPTTSHMFIVMPLSGRGVTKLFSTHPPIQERIRRLLAGRTGSL